MNDGAVIQQYRKLRSCRAVAELYGVSSETIRRVLIANGTNRTGWKRQPEHARPKKKYNYSRPYVPVSYNTVCEYCGKAFISHNKSARFCSKKCKDVAYRLKKGIGCNYKVEPSQKTCPVCGKTFYTFRERTKTCSCECSKQYKNRSRKTYGRRKEGQQTWSEYISGLRVKRLEKDKQKHSEREIYIKRHTVRKTCVICGAWFTCLDSEQRKTCSRECSTELNRRHRDKRIPKEQRIDNITLKRLYSRDNGVCYICGGRCDWHDWKTSDSGYKYPGPLYPTIEHVIPICFGGLDSWDNVRLAHWQCNLDKGVTVDDEHRMLPNAIKPAAKTGAKKTAQYTLNGELIKIWDSTADIRKELKINDKHIQNVCRKDRSKTGNAYGYHWEYVT